MRATQKQIAEMLGIDRTTVSKALSGSPTVSEALRERVRQLCSELGYRPHASALSLKSERTRTVSLVGAFTDVEGIQGMWVMRLHHSAQKRGYRCRIDTHEDAVSVVSEASADGFVVFGANNASDFSGGTALPAVFTDCSGLGGPRNSVTTGNAEAASEAVAYLNSLGHEGIVFFGLVRGHGVSTDRCRGYMDEMAKRNLTIPDDFVIVQKDWPVEVEDHDIYGDQLLSAVESGATAVIATKDVTAAAVIRRLSEKGIRVPEDVSVVAWDDTLVTRTGNPPLTTIRQNLEPAADKAMDMLIRMIERDEREIPGVIIPSTLILRGSVAPVGSRARIPD